MLRYGPQRCVELRDDVADLLVALAPFERTGRRHQPPLRMLLGQEHTDCRRLSADRSVVVQY